MVGNDNEMHQFLSSAHIIQKTTRKHDMSPCKYMKAVVYLCIASTLSRKFLLFTIVSPSVRHVCTAHAAHHTFQHMNLWQFIKAQIVHA